MIGGSPSLARSRRIVVFTAVVNGSVFSSQTRASNSSVDTTRSPAESRHSKRANSLGLSSRRRPSRNAARRLGSRVRSPCSRVGGSEVERLRQVVISSAPESVDALLDATGGRQHQDPALGLL